MHRRLYPHVAALIGASLLSTGCTQMTRHSNMLVFGTNTVIGARVGTAATQVPSIDIGYSRQEAALVPLVANVKSVEGKDGSHYLVPCDPASPVTISGSGKFAVHPCSLVAVNGSAQDSYSVLASFGAKFGGKSTSGQAEASGGLAQYFATGLAAQLLALNGGASVVAVSTAAEESGKHPVSENAVKALFSNPDAYARGEVLAKDYMGFQADLIGFVQNPKIAEADLAAQMTLLETDAKFTENLAAVCTTRAACAKDITTNYRFSANYDAHKDALRAALAARKVANGL